MERIELRFNTNNPNEKKLVALLAQKGNEYGAKGRFLKERLLTGHKVISDQVEEFLAASDPLDTLDQHATQFDAAHYRVLRTLLTLRLAEMSDSTSDSTHPVPPLVPVPEAVPEAVAVAAAVAAPVAAAVAAPVTRHDWSAFAGIAGIKKKEEN